MICGPRAVDDDDLVACGVVLQHDGQIDVARHGAAELHDDARHVVYSAFSFT